MAIDWTKDVEVATLGHEDWEDFQPIHVNQDHVYGHLMRQDATQATVWNFSIVHFRNKPAEPKRVKGWLCLMKHNNAGTYHIGRFFHDTYDSARQYTNAEHPYATCVGVFEIDVPEGHGLEACHDR